MRVVENYQIHPPNYMRRELKMSALIRARRMNDHSNANLNINRLIVVQLLQVQFDSIGREELPGGATNFRKDNTSAAPIEDVASRGNMVSSWYHRYDRRRVHYGCYICVSKNRAGRDCKITRSKRITDEAQ
jgi:hypothetical protein